MISYLNANDGKIELWADMEHLIAEVQSAESIAQCIKQEGVSDVLMGSSSMDFASEYGFDYDGEAQDLWFSGVEQSEMLK